MNDTEDIPNIYEEKRIERVTGGEDGRTVLRGFALESSSGLRERRRDDADIGPAL
jgi:hypothetical protein